MRGLVRLAFATVMLLPMAASGDDSPQVVLATPGIDNGGITRFTARFNQPMIPLGDPRATGPFSVDCISPGAGRWVDQRTYVHEFTTPLPGGARCAFTLRNGLKSVAGYAVTGQTRFTVDAGGPTVRAIMPGEHGARVEEDQLFVIAANLAPDPRSVAANAYCAVDGIGEKIPVDVQPAAMAGNILAGLIPSTCARTVP